MAQAVEKITDVKEAVRRLADECEKFGGTASDDDGTVRYIVEHYGQGFGAWFCVCCELADRSAQREGFKNQGDRAASYMRAH